MKKYLATMICVMLLTGIAFAGGDPEQVSYGPAGAPVLEYYEGRFTINGDEPELGQKIAPGSVVQSGADSYGEIVIGHNVVKIYENSIAVVDVDALSGTLDLKTGAIGAVLDKVETISSGGSFSVQTPTVAMGVRGTVFYVKVEDLDQTYVCTCNGTVHLDGVADSATHHAAKRFTAGEDGSVSSESAGLFYHDDAEMESIAATIDSTIDWK